METELVQDVDKTDKTQEAVAELDQASRVANRKYYETINVETLNAFEDGTEVTPELLFANKFLNKNKAKAGVKILGDGELNKKLTVKAHKFTKSAVEKIENAGGTIEELETKKWDNPSKKA